MNSTGGTRTPDEKHLACEIGKRKDLFVLKGLLNNKVCSFKLDTDSDVSIVSSRVAGRFNVKDC